MGVADGFKGAGICAKIALIFLILAALCIWISFTTTGWGRTDNVAGVDNTYMGLWRVCSDNEMSAGCSQIDGWGRDYWAATQAMVSLGFLGINVALLLLILYIFVSSCMGNGELGIATAIICFVSGACLLAGVIIFGCKFDEIFIDQPFSTFEFNYGFGLAIVALLFELVAGVLVIIDCKKGGGTSPSG